MTSERRLDVRGLEPPEPLERVLAAIESLADGQYLYVRHHREPFPLYPILEEFGFAWQMRPGADDDVPFEIFIWRRGDERARAEIRRRHGTAA